MGQSQLFRNEVLTPAVWVMHTLIMITIRGRAFDTSCISGVYTLTSKMGTVYTTQRAHTDDSLMFLVPVAKPIRDFQHLWLTDASGVLEVVGAL